MRQDGLLFENILEEVPLVLKTSHLGRALLEELRLGLQQDEVLHVLCLLTPVI
jgi:hypothetical protein